MDDNLREPEKKKHHKKDKKDKSHRRGRQHSHKRKDKDKDTSNERTPHGSRHRKEKSLEKEPVELTKLHALPPVKSVVQFTQQQVIVYNYESDSTNGYLSPDLNE